MSARTSLNVSLTPELEKFVQGRVKSGRYQTASEVIREGLRLLEDQERQREQSLASLKAKLTRGASQALSGQLVDPDDVLKKINALKRRRSAKRQRVRDA